MPKPKAAENPALRLDRLELDGEVGRPERDREVAEERLLTEQTPRIGLGITESDLSLPDGAGCRQPDRGEGRAGGNGGDGQRTAIRARQGDAGGVGDPDGQERVQRPAVDEARHMDLVHVGHTEVEQRPGPATSVSWQLGLLEDHGVDSADPVSSGDVGIRQTRAVRL